MSSSRNRSRRSNKPAFLLMNSRKGPPKGNQEPRKAQECFEEALLIVTSRSSLFEKFLALKKPMTIEDQGGSAMV